MFEDLFIFEIDLFVDKEIKYSRHQVVQIFILKN